MKRPKSKRFKKHGDMIRAAVSNIPKRKLAVSKMEAAKEADERRKDEEFVQKNRLEIEINMRHPI